MLNFTELLEREYENEYESEYDLSLKQKFSTPKIYTGKGDIKKRWYVYFSFADPETGKLKRQKPIYGSANKYKTKEERLAVLTTYQKLTLKLLNQGYSPYVDNSERFNTDKDKKTKPGSQVKDTINTSPKIVQGNNEGVEKVVDAPEPPKTKIKEAFAFDRAIKEKTLKASSQRSYFSHIKGFETWLRKQKPKVAYLELIDKKMVINYLNEKLKESSARTRNNYRASLSSFFQTLKDNEMIKDNFIQDISILKSTPTRNKTYTNEQQEEIFEFLEKEDPLLLLYIQFISYNFLRPIEVCRLKVGDLDMKNKILSVKAKNSPLKTKIIPQILFDELPDLSEKNRDLFLFTPDSLIGEWDTTDDNKRNYFSKRFKKVVKDEFNLGAEYGLYSFRHTFITKLYRSLVKESNPHTAKGELMQITGHSTMSALEQYLRDIDAELPIDYSDRLSS